MSLEDALKLSLSVLKQVMEEKITSTNIQLATVTKQGLTILAPSAVDPMLASLTS